MLAALIFFAFALTLKSQSLSAEEEFASAAHLTAMGGFEESILHWKRADSLFEHAKNFSKQVDTEIHLAAAYHALGQTNLAIEILRRVEAAVAEKADVKHVAAAKVALGAIYILSTPPMQMNMDHGAMSEGDAEANLKEGLDDV